MPAVSNVINMIDFRTFPVNHFELFPLETLLYTRVNIFVHKYICTYQYVHICSSYVL